MTYEYRAAGLDVNDFLQHAEMDRRVRNLPASDPEVCGR
jgi:hypothetical protein